MSTIFRSPTYMQRIKGIDAAAPVTYLNSLVRSIARNRTGIEDWILEKANHRRKDQNEKFIFPYDLGWWENFKQVFTFGGQPVGDGMTWPVREGCNQFTLTIEQIQQKNEKRMKTRMYKVIKPVSGYWFPIVHGLRVCCNFPCTDETRLKLDVNDSVRVTRWRKHWLFGEKIQIDLPEGQEALLRQRGWFPRPCAVEVTDIQDGIPGYSDKKIK